MFAVMKFYHMVRSGISFKVNETVIELWQSSYESDDNKSSTTISLCDDDDYNPEGDVEYSNCSNFPNEDIFDCNDEDISDKNCDDKKRAADEGSDENCSLLVAYDVNSIMSLWQKRSRIKFVSLVFTVERCFVFVT